MEAFSGRFAKVCGEVGDDEKEIFFGDASGFFVILGDRVILVPEIHLDDFFDLLGELIEAGFDVVALGPDATIDEGFFVVGEVHEAGEIFAEADGVDDGESEFPWRGGGEEAEDDIAEGLDDFWASGLVGFEEERAVFGVGEGEGDRELWGIGEWEARGLGEGGGGEVEMESGEAGRWSEVGGGRPLIEEGIGPREEVVKGVGLEVGEFFVERGDGGLPVGFDGGPGGDFFGIEAGGGGGKLIGDARFFGVEEFGDLLEGGGFLVSDDLEFGAGESGDLSEEAWDLGFDFFAGAGFEFGFDLAGSAPIFVDEVCGLVEVEFALVAGGGALGFGGGGSGGGDLLGKDEGA